METKIVAMRMPTELHTQVMAMAKQEHRNVTQTILYLIEKSLTLQAPTQSNVASRPSTSDGCAAPDQVTVGASQPAYE